MLRVLPLPAPCEALHSPFYNMAEPTALPASLPNAEHVLLIVKELGPSVKVHQVATTAQLLKEGATVPFIARYRKEMTGELDEVQITTIRDRLEQLAQLDERRAVILASLKERGLLTPALDNQIALAETLVRLEDIYLPFRPKKRTRATIAKWTRAQEYCQGEPLSYVLKYPNPPLWAAGIVDI